MGTGITGGNTHNRAVMPCDAAPSRLLACLAALCFAFREGAPSAASPVVPFARARRLTLESCPEFKPFDVAIDSGETKAPVCSWHLTDQRCFQSGINSQDNSSFNDVTFHCAMSKAVSVENGKELRVRGKLDNDPGDGPVELVFQSTLQSTFTSWGFEPNEPCPSNQPDGETPFDHCNDRHFKVEPGGKLKLMNLHLKGGKAVKYTRYCERKLLGSFKDPCWLGSVMEDLSCSGGSIHVASGGQVVLMGVTFGDNTAYGYANGVDQRSRAPLLLVGHEVYMNEV